jgi:hypothetical protein
VNTTVPRPVKAAEGLGNNAVGRTLRGECMLCLVNLVAAWRSAMSTLFGLDCVRARMRALLILPSVALLLQPLFAQAGSNAAVATPSEVLELEDNWSKNMWVSNGGMFYSGYSDLDEYLKAKAPPPNAPPLTAEYQQKVEHLHAEAMKDRASLDPDAKCHVCGAGCLPYGVPLVLTMPQPFKFQFSPGMVVVLSTQGYRKISTDIGMHPKDLDPTYSGHSIARWKGDTLIVDTVGLSDKTVIEPGLPHSDQLHVVEHWRQIGPDELQNRVVIIDPKAFTHPWVATKTYQRVVGVEPREKPCM